MSFLDQEREEKAIFFHPIDTVMISNMDGHKAYIRTESLHFRGYVTLSRSHSCKYVSAERDQSCTGDFAASFLSSLLPFIFTLPPSRQVGIVAPVVAYLDPKCTAVVRPRP